MKATVLSDGGWGTALALVLFENGNDVTIWGPFADYIEEMKVTRKNSRYLKGAELPEGLKLTSDMNDICDSELIVLATPSQYMRGTLESLKEVKFTGNPVFVNVAKGIEVGTLKRMDELFEEYMGSDASFSVLSGPSHAEEVYRKVPTAVTAASEDIKVAKKVQSAFMNENFRVYTSSDVVGLELGGALKNVLALAAGICDGMEFGDNTKAALMTRGIVEMARLGSALGGHADTFSGLSGTGDLIVTCMSRHSRNRHVGEELGKGNKLKDIQESMGGMVAEGVMTAQSAHQLARKIGVETPITDQVYYVLYEDKDPQQAVRDLMTRAPKSEEV